MLINASFSAEAQCNGSTILCNKPYNEVAYLTTHNSYNSAEGNFSLPNQNFNVNTQLNNGVRGFMIDVYDSGGEPTVYHGSPILGSNPLIGYFNQIHDFLTLNPNEVITIILECYTDANSIENVVNQAGLTSFLYQHDTLSNAWPTLQNMISSNKRLVIFSDMDDASPTQGWYHYVWDYAVETHYSVSNQNDFNCDFNRGDSINDLFIFNHFVTTVFGTGDENAASQVNANPFFLNRVVQCQAEKNKFPNFITVDFYDLGNSIDVVNYLNGVVNSIEDQNVISSDKISLFPNPSKSTINIEISPPIKLPYEIKIIDSLGKEIEVISEIKQKNISIKTNYNPGIYFLLITDKKNKIYTTKFISN